MQESQAMFQIARFKVVDDAIYSNPVADASFLFPRLLIRTTMNVLSKLVAINANW